MRDIRDSDLVRKISLMKGIRLHTFEHRLSEMNFVLQYTLIRCIVLDGDINHGEMQIKRISKILSKIILTETLYELYMLFNLILQSDAEIVKQLDIDEYSDIGDMMNDSEFMSQIRKFFKESIMSQILLYESDPNDIEGLPEGLTEITLVISLKNLNDGETVIVSDDEVITISD